MAEKLLRYYKYVNNKLGTQGKLELAKITRIPSLIASLEPDSEKNLSTFKHAVEKITNTSAPEY